METTEEIEQLAEKYYPPYPDGTITDEIRVLREGFIKGYSCQEDMLKDVEYWQGEYENWHKQAMEMAEYIANKKYTEEQLLDAMSFAECYIIEHDKPLFLKSNGKPVPDCLEYINSLNKQD